MYWWAGWWSQSYLEWCWSCFDSIDVKIGQGIHFLPFWDCRDGSFRGPRNRGALPCLQKAAIGEPSELYYYERNKAGWAGWAGWEFAAVVGCTVQKDEQWETLIGKSDETRLGRSQESLPVGWKKPFSLRPEVSTLQVQVRSWYSEITS